MTIDSPASNPSFEIQTDWIHIKYEDNAAFTETYGFAGNQGAVNLEAVRIRPVGRESATLFVFMHPASTLQLLPVPRAFASKGAHVLCAASRYSKNDSALIFEKVVLDLGAHIRHAKEKLGYTKIVLVGWSGGGALATLYQSEAENPTITHAPSGEPVDLTSAGLIPADALILQAAHVSRAQVLLDMIDPSVLDELNPKDRDLSLDIYDPGNDNHAPYSAEFIVRYREAQLARMRRITRWVKKSLDELKALNNGELEHCFLVHRTLADLRFLDPAIDPNDRRANWCYMGNPQTVNTGPVGLARFTTLRSWLSQWSIDDSRANGEDCVTRISTSLLVIENTADDVVPQPHPQRLFDAAISKDKTFKVIHGATHYYAGQPELLEEVVQGTLDWVKHRNIAI